LGDGAREKRGGGGGENLKKQAKPANSPGRPLGKLLARREAVIRATSVLKTKNLDSGWPSANDKAMSTSDAAIEGVGNTHVPSHARLKAGS
jgi:hypothetical protein